MKLYQHPKCSTCVKAAKYLKQLAVDFESINIIESPPTKAELKAMLLSYNGDIRKLFNVSGEQYRELKMKDKLPLMSDAQAIDLLASNGKLIKRPFLLNDKKQGIVGFKEEGWQQFLGA